MYPYERQPVPESAHVSELVRKAELNLRRRLEMFDVFPDWRVSFRSALDHSDLGHVTFSGVRRRKPRDDLHAG